MGNRQSAEETLPQPTAAPPPSDPYGFEQYKWAYIAGCIFGLVIIAFVINKLCCSSKEEEQLKNDKLELYHLQQQQVGHVQRQQYLGTPNVNSNSLKMYATSKNGNYVDRGLSLQSNSMVNFKHYNDSNRLIYNPQYSEVRANEPYILSNTSSINTSSYQMPLRDHSSPLGGHRPNYDSRGNPNFESNSRHDSTFGSRRNSLGYRSVRSQKAITASTPNHFGEPLESTSKSIILDDLDIVELDSVDDFDIRSQDSRKSRRSRPKSMRSINDVIEEKIEQEVERRVREEVAQLREQVEQELSLNKQKSILKEKSLRFDH